MNVKKYSFLPKSGRIGFSFGKRFMSVFIAVVLLFSTSNVYATQQPTDNLPTDNLTTDNLPTDNLTTDNLPTDNLTTDNLPTDNLPTDNSELNGITNEETGNNIEGDNITNLQEPINMLLKTAAGPVKFLETEEYFDTLFDAVEAVNILDLNRATLVVTGDTTESQLIQIKSNITIVGDNGEHTITFTSGSITVQDGGSLTLGDGTKTNVLTILRTVTVTDGRIDVKDGVVVKGGTALTLKGPNASGTINGGEFEGNTEAVSLSDGAVIDEISGGVFTGGRNALYLTGSGTRVDLISGGSFYQTDPGTTLHGHGIFIQDSSSIGEISGGYFEAAKGSGLALVRGARVGEISGGEFTSKHLGVGFNDRNSAVRILGGESGYGATRIDKISGGHFYGTNFGMLLTGLSNSPAQIGDITGGTFEGTSVGLQNDTNCSINEILGGAFIGAHGLFNASRIEKIGGNADFRGTTGNGIINWAGSYIGEISGGVVTSTDSDALANAGTIELISGGIFTGRWAAIHSDGNTKGLLNTISCGVFQGGLSEAIRISHELRLEPNLTAKKGIGRYLGRNGQIFNNESLVVYPGEYVMSTKTEPVEGIDNVNFKFLTLPEYTVTIENSYADVSGAGFCMEGDTVTISAGTREGYEFGGWLSLDGIVFADSVSETTTFTMPGKNVTVNALWINMPSLYLVTVNNSHASVNGAGFYMEGDTVTISAGTREGYEFGGWLSPDGIVFADSVSETTTFTMPGKNVTVNALWINMPSLYLVTVNNSHAIVNGTGGYRTGDTVTISAGTREGYEFGGWLSPDGIVFTDSESETTTFTMPGKNVTVNALWINMPSLYLVTVNNSHASVNGTGGYRTGDTVTISAGTREGYEFGGWLSPDGIEFADSVSETTTFIMPDKNVTVNALWINMPSLYLVTVNNSHASVNGTGGYRTGDTVTISAGTWEGYEFGGWSSPDGIEFADSQSETTTFTMSGKNVTVNALWTAIPSRYQVTVNNCHASVNGTGLYEKGDTVTISAGTREGYEFGGWSSPDGIVFSDSESETTTFTMPNKNVTVNALWNAVTPPEELPKSPEEPSTPPIPPVQAPEVPSELPLAPLLPPRASWKNTNTSPQIDTDLPAELPPAIDPLPLSGLHHAYIIGYPDGNVRPNNNVTRAEAATILFRLISDEYRAQVWSQSNPFADINTEKWYNNAISTMHNAGIVTGYNDGYFQPNKAITRAEFAALIVRAMGLGHVKNITLNIFSDIHDHWAKDYINIAYMHNWVQGYSDGTFNPNRSITRAEVAALVNRALNRLPQFVSDLHTDMVIWDDNTDQNAWYYLHIQEASNSNYYIMKDDGLHKTWTGLFTPRDWRLLERPYSNPNM